MASNYPTSLDSFTNPSAGNTLDSPSHSLQHSDINDAVEALETKIGIGDSPAGSATSGQVLTAQGGGTAIWATPDAGGLVLINTTSFSAVASQSIDDVFSSTYQNYKVVLQISASTGNANLSLRWRTGSPAADVTATNYERAGFKNYVAGATITAMNAASQNGWIFAGALAAAGARGGGVFEIQKPFDSSPTVATYGGMNQDGGGLGHWSNSAMYTAATSMTGFSIIADTGAISGTVSTYGYRKN